MSEHRDLRIWRPSWAAFLLVTSACDGGLDPTGPGPLPEVFADITVEGQVTSAFDGSPVTDVAIRGVDYVPGRCDGLAFVCPATEIVLGEALSGPDGSFELEFARRCSPEKTVPIHAERDGYAPAKFGVECNSERQVIPLELRPVASLEFELEPDVPAAGRPVTLRWLARSPAGLEHLSITWQLNGATEGMALSGTAQSGQLVHVYEHPGAYGIKGVLEDTYGNRSVIVHVIAVSE